MQLLELCLEITEQCIMKCVHCSTSNNIYSDRYQELIFDDIKYLLLDFKKLGGSILEISGGEPTLYPKLSEIVTYSKTLGLEVRLYTCGVSIGENIGPLDKGLLVYLYDLGLDKIIFNLQGPDSNIHDQITGVPGSFFALLESIRTSKKLGFWVGAHFVPMKPNAEFLGAVLSLARDLHIDELALLRFVSQGRGKINEESLKLTEKELWNFLEKVAVLRKEFIDYINVRTGCPLDFLSFIDHTIQLCSCKAGKSTCSITPSGDVIPCPGFKHLTEFVAGNIKSQGLRSIWENSDILNNFRKLNYHDISECSECSRINICKGRCAAQRVRKYGDILKGPDPDCLGPFVQKDEGVYPPIYRPSKTDKISELSIG